MTCAGGSTLLGDSAAGRDQEPALRRLGHTADVTAVATFGRLRAASVDRPLSVIPRTTDSGHGKLPGGGHVAAR